MKYTINELANSKGVSQPVREALLQMADYKQLYEQVCEQYDVLAKELEATNRQVEILSDALAESRREVAQLKAQRQWVGLSHEEVMDSWDEIRDGDWAPDFYAVIEAKLKEKNT
jgi:flagellar biosynthesis chaperone FliJ